MQTFFNQSDINKIQNHEKSKDLGHKLVDLYCANNNKLTEQDRGDLEKLIFPFLPICEGSHLDRLMKKSVGFIKIDEGLASFFLSDQRFCLDYIATAPFIDDAILKEIIESNNLRRILAISKRCFLTEDILSLLVNTEQKEIIESLFENPYIAFSVDQLKKLIPLNVQTSFIYESIFSDSEENFIIGFIQREYLARHATKFILRRYHLHSETIIQKLLFSMEGMARGFSRDIDFSLQINPVRMLQHLSQGNKSMFLEELASLSQLRPYKVEEFIVNCDHNFFLIALKSIGLPANLFASVVRHLEQGISSFKFKSLMESYDKLPVQKALAHLHFLRKSSTLPHYDDDNANLKMVS